MTRLLARGRELARGNTLLRGAVRSCYGPLNWLRSRPMYYGRIASYLRELDFDDVRFSNRGNEPEAHLRRTKRLADLARADVLILGAGDGAELPLWQAQRARTLAACDVFAHDAWRSRADVRFSRMDARYLAFGDASFDVVASTALLEHVPDIEALCDEMARVLRPGGLVFANFGPLYYTYGGAHYLGAYEHLLMDDAAFERWLIDRDDPYERSEALHWLRHGMFSRRSYDDYLAIFRDRFDIEHLAVAVSPQALRHRRRHPEEWRLLRQRYSERDLLTFAITVWMRPRHSSARRLAGNGSVSVDVADGVVIGRLAA